MASAATDTEPHPVVVRDVSGKKRSLGKRILGLLWDSLDDKPPEEHRVVRRLDSFFLVWACFYYFVMYLDSSEWPLIVVVLLHKLIFNPSQQTSATPTLVE